MSAVAFLAQVSVCCIGTALLLGTERVLLSGIFFWGVLGLLLARAAFTGRSEETLCLLIALGPFISLLRGFAFYNVVGVLSGLALAWHFSRTPRALSQAFAMHPFLKPLFVYVMFYYSLSLFNTHDYSVNLRLFELAFTVLTMVLLGRERALLGMSLVGAMICAWAVGAAMLSHVNSESVSRLGVMVVSGYVLGNPTQLGIPLALGFLAVIIDQGRWLNLETKPVFRWLLLVPTLPLLALTTSRSSWLVSAAGLLVNMVLGRRQRVKMLCIVGVIIVAINAVLVSPYGKSLQRGFDRTFDSKRTSAQRTSGRSDQWRVSWHAFTLSPFTMLLGHGPGKGPEIYARYSSEVAGIKYAVGHKAALHSLFMQIGVEAGLLGLVTLMTGLLYCYAKTFKHYLRTHELFPLICFLGYVFIVITVSGNDVNSGIFLGITMLGVTAAARTQPAARTRKTQWKPAWTH